MKKPAKSRKACTKLPWELAETSFRSLFKPLKSFFWGLCLNCTKSPQQGFLQGCIFIFLTTAFPDLLVGISQLQRRFSWTKQLAFKPVNRSKQSFQRAFFCAEICTISAQNPQCLHKSLHQNQTKKARKCDKAHVATKARNHHITEAFSRQKSTLFCDKKPKKSTNNCFNF